MLVTYLKEGTPIAARIPMIVMTMTSSVIV